MINRFFWINCLLIIPLLIEASAEQQDTEQSRVQTLKLMVKGQYSNPEFQFTVYPNAHGIKASYIFYEGDVISSQVPQHPKKTIVTWQQTRRYKSGEKCRTRWFRRKCTITYANETNTEPCALSAGAAEWNLKIGLKPLAGGSCQDLVGPGNEIIVRYPSTLCIQGGSVCRMPQEIPGNGNATTGVTLLNSISSSGEPFANLELSYTRPSID